MNKEELFEGIGDLKPDLIEEAEAYGKMRAAGRWKRSLLAVACALALFVALPNISMTAALAMEKIPIIGKLVEAVTFRDYEEEGEHHQISLNVPGVSVDGQPVEDINEDIERMANELMSRYREATEEQNLFVQMDYEVIAAHENYFTLKLDCFEAEAGGYQWSRMYTISRATGEQIHLADLFKEGVDYVTPISENILTQMKQQMEADEHIVYFFDQEDEADNFKAIDSDQDFYLSASGMLVISFDEYEVAPGSMGPVSFEIPLHELTDILRDDNTL